MWVETLLAAVAILSASGSALPAGLAEVHGSSVVVHPRCGAVSAFYGQTAGDWSQYYTDDWLNTWWSTNQANITSNTFGWAGAFGFWATGNPDWSCRDDGSSSDCDFDPCDNRVLNDKGDDVREAYYVLESTNRLHSYFMGLEQGFEVAAIGAALSKDSWATTFYKDKDVKSVGILREILNAIGTIIGIGAALAGLGEGVADVAAGAAAALFTGAAGAATPLIGQHQDDTFQKSADLGGILGTIVVDSMESFTTANNQLMHGDAYANTGDIKTYFKNGLFLDFAGVDKNLVTDQMSNMLIGLAVNQLWRTQKIFIMGGGACGDNQGIGQGPQQYSVCRDGKAWYLYYWQENNVISTTSHQWGWVNVPPGGDQLGQGLYAGVTVQDVVSSSLDAYNVAGYNYTSDTAAQRAQSALQDGWGNPGASGPSWEGIFTIPVCDVSGAVNADYQDKEYILQDYGHDSRPVWCGPVCSGDLTQTTDFIQAANMQNFDSPKHLCDTDPGYD